MSKVYNYSVRDALDSNHLDTCLEDHISIAPATIGHYADLVPTLALYTDLMGCVVCLCSLFLGV